MTGGDEDVEAAPGQQGWQSAAAGRRDGGWCRCNSKETGEEESPERGEHMEEEEGKETGGGVKE